MLSEAYTWYTKGLTARADPLYAHLDTLRLPGILWVLCFHYRAPEPRNPDRLVVRTAGETECQTFLVPKECSFFRHLQ